MQAKVKRDIASGKEYDYLFPRPKGQNLTIRLDAQVGDTLALIQKTVPLSLKDTGKIAKVLQGNTLEETCENIWNFVYHHIQYKRDEKGIEQVRRPARAWWDRQTGVDCDCYTEFISSILTNLSIPHKLRITKYDYNTSYSHIYPIVPIDGDANKPLTNRNDYIVIDCVKNNFDDEQPFTDFKDYIGMRLDYLNGFDDGFRQVETTDVGDLSSLVDDKELNGKFGNWLKNTGKKGFRFLNRFTNPGAITMRNGFLLAMKVNFVRLASRLRFAYLTDEQARAKGMDMGLFRKLQKIKDKAEEIYFLAGGKKENLKKAILHGKGNKDRQVPLDGLNGLDDVYADQQEYNIIHHGSINGFDTDHELGEVAAAASIASATAIISSIAGALSKVKGLFKKGTPEAKAFDAGSNDTSAQPSSSPEADSTNPESTGASSSNMRSQARISTPSQSQQLVKGSPNENQAKSSSQDQTTSEEDPAQSNPDSAGTAVPAQSTRSRTSSNNEQALVKSKTSGAASQDADPSQDGIFTKATSWVTNNPAMAVLLVGAIAGGSFLLLRKKLPAQRLPTPLNGFKKGQRKNKKKRSSTSKSKLRITPIDL